MSKNEQKLQTDDEFGVLTAEEIKLMKRGFLEGNSVTSRQPLSADTGSLWGFFFVRWHHTDAERKKKYLHVKKK